MKLTYQTSIGTLIQLILLSLLTLVSQIFSTISSCTNDEGGGCLGDIATSIIFYMLVAIIFGSIWLLGAAAQTRRSKRLAQLLICTEGVVALGALFSLKVSLHGHGKNAVGLFASFGILIMASWIITLAFRLMRAEGGRVGSSQRRRRRHTSSL